MVDNADDPEAIRVDISYDTWEPCHPGIGYDTPAEFERNQQTESITSTVPK